MGHGVINNDKLGIKVIECQQNKKIQKKINDCFSNLKE